MFQNNDYNQSFRSDNQGTGRPSVPPSDRLASLSMWCALFGIITFYTPPLALCLGSVAIILGLLSRGGHSRPNRRGRRGIHLGIACILLTAAVSAATLIYTFHQYGSLENFYKQYQKQIEKVLDSNQTSEGAEA